jgi:hypothetical protein
VIRPNEVVGHVARMVGNEVLKWFWWRNPKEKDSLEDPVVVGTIILKRIFIK